MDYLKFAQTFYLIKKIAAIVLKCAKKMGINWRDIGIILGGDFNSTPNASAIQLLMKEQYTVPVRETPLTAKQYESVQQSYDKLKAEGRL